MPTFMALLGGPAKANDALQHLAVNGRIVDHQEIAHIRFPLWERVDSSATG